MIRMSPSDALRAARALLADPVRWTQGLYARDADDRNVMISDERATKWCIVGALAHVTGDDDHDAFCEAKRRLTKRVFDLGYDCIADYNDSVTHEEVLRLLDDAA